jgi:hypothetical protein
MGPRRQAQVRSGMIAMVGIAPGRYPFPLMQVHRASRLGHEPAMRSCNLTPVERGLRHTGQRRLLRT